MGYAAHCYREIAAANLKRGLARIRAVRIFLSKKSLTFILVLNYNV